jgi:hypothetical protein
LRQREFALNKVLFDNYAFMFPAEYICTTISTLRRNPDFVSLWPEKVLQSETQTRVVINIPLLWVVSQKDTWRE